MKKYKLNHEELTEIFKRWSAAAIAYPKDYSESAHPGNAGDSADAFGKWYKEVKSD